MVPSPVVRREYFQGHFRYLVVDNAEDDCPILFLPGLSGRAEHAWDVPGRKRIAIDYPGTGESVSDCQLVSTSKIAHMVWKLLDHLGIKKCEIYGFSMGGCVAQKMAILYPHRIAKMTLVNSFGGFWMRGRLTCSFEGFIMLISAAWFLTTTLNRSWMDMNSGYTLLAGKLESLPEGGAEAVVRRWQPNQPKELHFSIHSFFSLMFLAQFWARAKEWFQRHICGDFVHLIALLLHYVPEDEVKLLRTLGIDNRIVVIKSHNDPLVDFESSKLMSSKFNAPFKVIRQEARADGHMLIAHPFSVLEQSDILS